LKWQNLFLNNIEAIKWEKKIKGWTRKKKEALIEGKFDLLHELARCKNNSFAKKSKE
jgi:putative endonuclease